MNDPTDHHQRRFSADLLGSAGLLGQILPWRDVLHKGPLTPARQLEDLSEIRADYLSQRFGMPLAEARVDFAARDAVIRAHGLFDTVEIWLEHDLYDQLQLTQILDFFAAEGRSDGLRLVQADDFLATQRPEAVLRFADAAVDLTQPLVDAGSAIWRSLAEPSPESTIGMIDGIAPEFSFLTSALWRFVEELPSKRNGLSRTEQAIIAAVAAGGLTPKEVFRKLLADEEAAFMGDLSAFRILDDLIGADEAPVTGLGNGYPPQDQPEEIEAYLTTPLVVTQFGRSLLSGDADMIIVNGVDRWWAGTRLIGHDCWRWDAAAGEVIPPTAADKADTPTRS